MQSCSLLLTAYRYSQRRLLFVHISCTRLVRAKKLSRTKNGELARVQTFLRLLRLLLSSGSLRSVLEVGVAAALLLAPGADGNTAGRQVSGTRHQDEDAGWKRVQQENLSRNKLLQDGWSESEKHAGRVPTNKGGSLLGKCERSKDDVGGNALQWSLGSACSSQSQRKGYQHFCAGTRPERLYAEPAAILASVMYQSAALQVEK